MRKILSILLILIAAASTQLNAGLADIAALKQCEPVVGEKIELKTSMMNKYTSLAKRFMPVKSSSVETLLMTYEVINGNLCQIGWYTDGCIISAIDGPETGKQIIVLHGVVIGISYYVEWCDHFFVHHHPWGRVVTFPSTQFVKAN